MKSSLRLAQAGWARCIAHGIPRLDRTVAIKILPAHLSSNPEAKQRFEREARSISSLNHPNICTLYDVGHQDGIDYLVMEFLEGETLADRLMRGPLPLEQVLKYGIEICEGLEKAHRGGVTHRDLKPGNIMLTKTGANLMDFGLAKATTASAPPASSMTMTLSGPSAEQPLTARGTLVGTFQYMSPEQLEGKEADARSDIFALGAVLYEMATGKRAFTGKTQASIVAAILASDPPPISTVQPMSPPALDRVVKVCLAKDPDERFQNVHDVMLQLKWTAEGGSQAGVSAPVASQRKTRERILWGALALLFAGCVGLAAIHFGAVRSERQVIHAYIPPPEKSTFAFVGDYTGPLMIHRTARFWCLRRSVRMESRGCGCVHWKPRRVSRCRERRTLRIPSGLRTVVSSDSLLGQAQNTRRDWRTRTGALRCSRRPQRKLEPRRHNHFLSQLQRTAV